MNLLNNQIYQKEYLKKYMSLEDNKKKKKKKVNSSSLKRSKIIDDDIDLKSMRPLEDDEVELYQMGEDAPQVAGVIDERPPELKAQEYYSSKRWRVFGGEEGVSVYDNMDKKEQSNKSSSSNSLYTQEHNEQKHSVARKKNSKRKDLVENKIIGGKLTKRTKSESSESDVSPPRTHKRSKEAFQKQNCQKLDSDTDVSVKRQTKDCQSQQSDSDFSPPRNNRNNRYKQKYDSDSSPSKKSNIEIYTKIPKDSNLSLPRKERDRMRETGSNESKKEKKRRERRSDSDVSPLRKGHERNRTHTDESSRRLKKNSNKYRSDSDTSLPRKEQREKYKYNSDSDNSPPRKCNIYNRNIKDSDSDNSPPRINERRKGVDNKYNKSDSDSSNQRYRKEFSSKEGRYPENDRRKHSMRSNTPDKFRKRSDKLPYSDKSNKNVSSRLSRRDTFDEKNIKRNFSDSDDSPPRRSNIFHHEDSSDLSPPRKQSATNDKVVKKALYKPNNDSSSSDEQYKNEKMKTTLDGKRAGLQDAKTVRKELSDLKKKEDAMFSKMDASVSGVGAAPIKRDRKTGQVRDLEKEKEAQKEKDAKTSVIKEKYYKWGKGIKQVEDAAERMVEVIKEMNKPLARYVDDEDLDNLLKNQEREGDPMLEFIKRKQKEATLLVGAKPLYQGSYNPNRFGIRPGHRWDGVVRSNGYEKEWFTHKNARKARDEEAYKWSTSDM